MAFPLIVAAGRLGSSGRAAPPRWAAAAAVVLIVLLVAQLEIRSP